MNIGLDLLDVARMERRMSHTAFMERVFSEQERAHIFSQGASAAQTAAGIFCAKEALAKATGLGLMTVLREHEVLYEPSGRPYFRLPGTSLSITHTALTAAAVVLYASSVR